LFTTGVPSLDKLLGGGYPDKSAILIEGPAGMGKEALGYAFVHSGLPADGCVYATKLGVSDVVGDAHAWAIELGDGPLWIAAEGGQARCDASDLAGLSFNIKELIRRNKDRRIRMVTDVLSTLLMLNSTEVVYKFLSQLIAEVKQYKAVMLVTVEEKMHMPQVVASMEQLFDGVINVEPDQEGEGAPPTIRIKRMHGVAVPTGAAKLMFKLHERPNDESAARKVEPNRIAVLPLSNFSPDPNDGYFAEGMTEELITVLSQVQGLRVIARTSAEHYKGKNERVSKIGKELGVGSVMEGSVRISRDKLRVTVQLINASTEEHVWSQTYDRPMEDVFMIQSDIARKVAEAMKVRMSERISEETIRRSTTNLEAYTLYLRAMQLHHESTEQTLREAVRLLEQAVSKDPGFARAYAGLAQTWDRLAGNWYEDFATATGRAEAAARKALELGPELEEPHAAMADVNAFLDRFEESISEAEEALKINPNLPEAYIVLGANYAGVGKVDQALTSFRKAYELDPLSSRAGFRVAEAYRNAGREDDALATLEKLRELNPRNPRVYGDLADCYLQQRDFVRAQQMLNNGLLIDPNEPNLRIGQGVLYALNGRRKEAERELLSLQSDGRESVRLFAQLYIQTALGNLDDAFKALSRHAENHSWPTWMKSDPRFEALRIDPRFAQFCTSVGLPP
jgi:TolB-like protein/KaiC/GvpD/RAD55 family RecA-like ATPase/Tfp pilus assembly protein PilF